MVSTGQEALVGETGTGVRPKITKRGDLTCPRCTMRLLVPEWLQLKVGICRCPMCDQPIQITRREIRQQELARRRGKRT